jgi:hypothetical protein
MQLGGIQLDVIEAVVTKVGCVGCAAGGWTVLLGKIGGMITGRPI